MVPSIKRKRKRPDEWVVSAHFGSEVTSATCQNLLSPFALETPIVLPVSSGVQNKEKFANHPGKLSCHP